MNRRIALRRPSGTLALVAATALSLTCSTAFAQSGGSAAQRAQPAPSTQELTAYLPPNPNVVFAIDVNDAIELLEVGIDAEGLLEPGIRNFARMIWSWELDLEPDVFDPGASRTAVVAVYGVTNGPVDASVVVATSLDVLGPRSEVDAEPSALGGSSMRAFTRDNVVVFGDGERFDVAAQMNEASDRFSLSTAWPVGAEEMPADAPFWVYVGGIEPVPAQSWTPPAMVAFRGSGFEQSVLWIDRDFGVSYVANFADPHSFERFLGYVQASGQHMLSEPRELVTDPTALAWLDYLGVVVESVVGRLDYELSEGITRLHLPPPACGSWPQQLAWFYGFFGQLMGSELIDPSETITFEPVEFTHASCESIVRPTPSLDLSFVNLATDSPNGMAAVAVGDMYALLTSSVQDGFGMFPYAIPDDAVESVLGAETLAELESDRMVVAYGEDIGVTTMPNGVIRLPSFAADFAALTYENYHVDEERGLFYGESGDVEAWVDRPGVDSMGNWQALVDAVPDGAIAAILVPRSAMSELLSEMPPMMNGGMVEMFRVSNGVVLYADSDGHYHARVPVPSDRAESLMANAEGNLEFLLTSASQMAGMGLGMTETILMSMTQLATRGLEEISFAIPEPGIIEISVDRSMSALLGTASLTFTTYLALEPYVVLQDRVRAARSNLSSLAGSLMYSSLVTDPNAPATSVGPTPPLEEITALCETGGPLPSDDGRWTEGEWADVGFYVYWMSYFSYDFETDGQGNFTAHAYGDLDCDGEFSTFTITGQRNGQYPYSDDVTAENPYE